MVLAQKSGCGFSASAAVLEKLHKSVQKPTIWLFLSSHCTAVRAESQCYAVWCQSHQHLQVQTERGSSVGSTTTQRAALQTQTIRAKKCLFFPLKCLMPTLHKMIIMIIIIIIIIKNSVLPRKEKKQTKHYFTCFHVFLHLLKMLREHSELTQVTFFLFLFLLFVVVVLLLLLSAHSFPGPTSPSWWLMATAAVAAAHHFKHDEQLSWSFLLLL